MEPQETRVRMGAKQTAKGTVQMDLTAEAPDVETAGDLLSEAITRMATILDSEGLVPVHKA